MSERYTLGNNPLRVDPRRVLLVKILNSINAGGGGGGGSGTTQISTSHGAPAGAPAAGIVLNVDLDSGALSAWNGSAWL